MNLPSEVTSFVGRRRETTLTGVAGVSKTRLALPAAARVREPFPDGVCDRVTLKRIWILPGSSPHFVCAVPADTKK
jgi:predicted ATPase